MTRLAVLAAAFLVGAAVLAPSPAMAGHPVVCMVKVIGQGPVEVLREGGCGQCGALQAATRKWVAVGIVTGSAGNQVTGTIGCNPTSFTSCTATVSASPTPPPPPSPPPLPPPIPTVPPSFSLGGDVGPMGACSAMGPITPGGVVCGWSYHAAGPEPSWWTVLCKYI